MITASASNSSILMANILVSSKAVTSSTLLSLSLVFFYSRLIFFLVPAIKMSNLCLLFVLHVGALESCLLLLRQDALKPLRHLGRHPFSLLLPPPSLLSRNALLTFLGGSITGQLDHPLFPHCRCRQS